VTLVHRRGTLDAEPDVLKAFEEAVAAQQISFITAQISQAQVTQQRLSGLQIEKIDGSTDTLPCDQ